MQMKTEKLTFDEMNISMKLTFISLMDGLSWNCQQPQSKKNTHYEFIPSAVNSCEINNQFCYLCYQSQTGRGKSDTHPYFARRQSIWNRTKKNYCFGLKGRIEAEKFETWKKTCSG